MKNLKIRVKLLASFIIVVALAVVIGVVGIFSLTSAADNTALLNDRLAIALNTAEMGRSIQQQRASYRGAALNYTLGMTDDMNQNLTNLEGYKEEFATLRDTMNAMLTTEEGKRLSGEINKNYDAFSAARDTFVASITDPNTTDEQMMALMAEVIPPSDATVAAIGELTVFVDQLTDEQATSAAEQASTTSIILVAVVVVAAVFSIILALYISSLISKPLAMMQTVLTQVGTTGNMNFKEEQVAGLRKQGTYKDEIGLSIAAFVGMMDRLLYVSDRLQEVANGDLTANVTLLGDSDTMGKALKDMDENLNYMFTEINSVASQVSTASTEIAQGAQSLAQGSTEQASTVEEISASINEITQQSNVSVKTATDSAHESQTIRNIAQDGNEKMDRLATAVQEMSEASQSIGNVIKVIDDIAFQTNILALNAAVEAARAGEHGKGFAVVADEVRNLAAKSAEAAKETAGLISANIEKSELGLTISHETAETLRQIVEGVENTTESLNTISQQSEAAKAATEQVNLAVDQVAQVVQQNSATSEESAAASEEMSSQAQVLQQLIARFKLKKMAPGSAPSTMHQSLPAATPSFNDDLPIAANGSVIF